MTITYSYGKNLYVNTTNRCDMHCDFCLRQAKLQPPVFQKLIGLHNQKPSF